MSIAEKITRAKADLDEVHAAGKAEGIAEGKQAEYDAFWDKLQQNGTRTGYDYGFWRWSYAILRPKYNIVPEGSASSVFRDIDGLVDFEQWKIECGIVVDFSRATSANDLFGRTPIERVGILDFSNISSANHCFSNSKVKTIEKIILPSSKAATMNSAFNQCVDLEEIRFDGVIQANGFSFSHCSKLTHDSLVSIVNSLSTTTTGLTVTLSKTAVNNAFATAEGAADGSTSAEWLALVATRSNWTIALA
jgi:hypothetical protein